MTAHAPAPLSPGLTHAPVVAPRGVVLMLHGGADRGTKPVDERSLSWQRSRRMMREIEDDLNVAGVAVTLLRYRVKGWNAHRGVMPSPVPDARWALEQVKASYPDTPIVLLGHSMGARTAVAVADDPLVAGVVALAPWFPRGEPVEALTGSVLHAAHGRKDRITSARATADFVARAARVGAEAHFHDMGRVGHYMFRAAGRWNEFAVTRSLALLPQ